jgi:hypothetical protein
MLNISNSCKLLGKTRVQTFVWLDDKLLFEIKSGETKQINLQDCKDAKNIGIQHILEWQTKTELGTEIKEATDDFILTKTSVTKFQLKKNQRVWKCEYPMDVLMDSLKVYKHRTFSYSPKIQTSGDSPYSSSASLFDDCSFSSGLSHSGIYVSYTESWHD